MASIKNGSCAYSAMDYIITLIKEVNTMDYKEEIITMVNSITQEEVLHFFYVLLRVATSDEDGYNGAVQSLSAFIGGFTE